MVIPLYLVREASLPGVTDDLASLADACHVLARALRRRGELDVELSALLGSEFEVLQQVARRPRSTLSAVARGVGMQVSNTSTAIRALVERGLVERVPDPADQRRSLLQPTAAALRHREQLRAAWSRTIAGALETLTAADAAAVRAAVPALSRLAETLSES
jgi:DNA-binding MarR family transcriptional regulator